MAMLVEKVFSIAKQTKNEPKKNIIHRNIVTKSDCLHVREYIVRYTQRTCTFPHTRYYSIGIRTIGMALVLATCLQINIHKFETSLVFFNSSFRCYFVLPSVVIFDLKEEKN